MRRKHLIALGVLVLALCAAAVGWVVTRPPSVEDVAARYVTATGGDLSALKETSTCSGSSVEEILARCGSPRRQSPITIASADDYDGLGPDVRHVRVRGKSAGRAFVATVTVGRADGRLAVTSEFIEPNDR